MFKILLTSLMTISLYAGDYVVDKAHTNVNFAIKHLTISLVTGVFHELDGTFTYDEKSGTLTALEGVVQTASIDTGVEKRNAHLKTADFFDADKYPTLTLKMKGVKGGKVFVDLHIKDVTKTVAFDYINGGAVTDPWGKAKGAFGLRGEINRFDFHINYDSRFDGGKASVGEIVQITINVEGYKQ